MIYFCFIVGILAIQHYTTLQQFLVYSVSSRLQWENYLNIFSSFASTSDGSVCKYLSGYLYLSLPLYFMAYSCNYSTSTSCNYPPFIKSNNHSSVCQTLSIPNLAAMTRLELQPLMTSRHKKTKRTPKYHTERIHPLQSTRDVWTRLEGGGVQRERRAERGDKQLGNGHWKTIVTNIIFYSVNICNVLQ